MRAYTLSNQRFNRELSLREISNINMNVALYKAIDTGRHVALTNQNGMALNHITELVIEEDIKTPLYKQAMAMQLGQNPHKYDRKMRKVLRLKQLSEDDKLDYMYKVYMARI